MVTCLPSLFSKKLSNEIIVSKSRNGHLEKEQHKILKIAKEYYQTLFKNLFLFYLFLAAPDMGWLYGRGG